MRFFTTKVPLNAEKGHHDNPKVNLFSSLLHVHPGYQTLKQIYFLRVSGIQGSQCVEQGNSYLFNPEVGKVKMESKIWLTSCLFEVSSIFFLENSLKICRNTWSALEKL